RHRISGHRLAGASLEPSEQVEIGRGQSGPNQLDFVRLLVAERCDRGFGEARRYADAQRAGDKLEQRPAPGLIELTEPACKLRGKLRFAQCSERRDYAR